VAGNGDPAPRHEVPSGHPLSLRRTFWRWDQRLTNMITTARSDHEHGRLPWVSTKTPSWADMGAGLHDAEIDGWFVDFQSACDVYEYIVACQLQACAFFEHCDEKCDAILIEALRHAAAGAVFGSGNESLDFNEQRSRAFHASRDDRSSNVLRAFL
jgi:hypothetical protein